MTATPSDAPAAAPVPGRPISTVVRIPGDAGGDPLVRAYLERHRDDCAWRTIAWAWVLYGAIGAIIGGTIGSHLAGAVPPLPEDVGGVAMWFNDHFGNAWGCVAGMGVAALLISAIGARARPGGVGAGQEPFIGMILVLLMLLYCYDQLLWLGIVTGTLCLVYFCAISFRMYATLLGGGKGLRAAELTPPATGWPLYTVLVPLYKERNVARNILASLSKLDYPHDRLDVKFLLEADDLETLPALEEAGIPAFAEIVVVPPGQPKTKPRACNHGLARARGELLVIFDAEDRPEPDQLKQAAIAFASLPARVVCLQAQLAYHNYRQNLLTRWFALEYNVWFRRYLGGLVRLGVPIPLGGTSNHFRTSVLQEVGGWDPFNVTEDCDLGVRLYTAGYRTLTLDSVTWEEANSRLGNWIRQRSRWLKGYLITHLVWGRHPVRLVRRLGPWGTVGFLLSVLCVGALSAFNLLLWVLMLVQGTFLAIDMSHGQRLWDLLATRDYGNQNLSWQMVYVGRLEDPVLSTMSQVFFAAAVCLLAGNLFFIVLALVAGRRPGQQGLWWAALLSPLYWVLIAVAAWKGVWQLVVKPHYWEKTVHGLDHDAGPGPGAPATAVTASPTPAPPVADKI